MIPAAAEKVVELIRKEVPKPQDLPRGWYACAGGLRWLRGVGNHCCPLGLLPRATSQAPWGPVGAGICSNTEDYTYEEWANRITAFTTWWDGQRDPVAAVEAVWC